MAQAFDKPLMEEQLDSGKKLTCLRWTLVASNLMILIIITSLTVISLYGFVAVAVDETEMVTQMSVLLPFIMCMVLFVFIFATAFVGFIGATVENGMMLYYHSCLMFAMTLTLLANIGMAAFFSEAFFRNTTTISNAFICNLWTRQQQSLAERGMTEILKGVMLSILEDAKLKRNKTVAYWRSIAVAAGINLDRTQGKMAVPSFCCLNEACRMAKNARGFSVFKQSEQGNYKFSYDSCHSRYAYLPRYSVQLVGLIVMVAILMLIGCQGVAALHLYNNINFVRYVRVDEKMKKKLMLN